MYSYMTTGEKAWFTKVIETYTEHKDTWAYRNELHTRMVEQAAADRALFMNSPAGSHIELRFPEYVYLLVTGDMMHTLPIPLL